MTQQLTGPRIPAANGKADRLIVFCHGYGADGNDLVSLGQHWQRALPTAAFSCPHAPERCTMSPMGYQWFPITRMQPEEMLRGVERAAPILNAFIDSELARLNLDASRLALVGFSQGTMMSLHVGLRRATPPAAIVGFSGTLPGPEKLLAEIVGRPPVLLTHGDADEMIPVQAMFLAANGLGKAGVTARWHVSRGIGHGIGPDSLDLAGQFLSDAFAGKLATKPENAPCAWPELAATS
ncbi:MAG: prolyl oligopeptidase family serine peptidase [Alphaproteobacteria bacterium]|nr:prolyl oligopeptidase family serine peptidase [Alphaproteobacteria bacterium]